MITFVIIFLLVALAIILGLWYWKSEPDITQLKRSVVSPRSFTNLADTYKNKIRQGKYRYCRHLADLYYSGSETHGIASDPLKAAKWYRVAIKKAGDIWSLVYLGDIYRNGDTPDPQLAWECYQKVIDTSPDPEAEVVAAAQERQREMRIDPPNPIVLLETLPTTPLIPTQVAIDPFRQPTQDWSHLFNAVETGYQGLNIEDRVMPDLTVPPPPTIEPLNVADFRHAIPEPMPNVVIQIDDEPDEIRNDPQNAHDSTLLRGARDTIKQLQQADRANTDNTSMLLALRKHIDNIPDHTRRHKAISVLDKIETNDLPMSNMYNLREVDILNLVYNRIHAPINQQRSQDLLDVLIDQLCDGFNSQIGSPFCATGRSTRVLSALDVVDAEADKLVTLKPKWAVKQELLNKAGRMREQMLQNQSPEFQEMYNKMDTTEEEEQLIEKFDDEFKQALRDQYKKEYVDPGILTQLDLNEELDKWIDSI